MGLMPGGFSLLPKECVMEWTEHLDVLGLVGFIAFLFVGGWILYRPKRHPTNNNTSTGEDVMVKHFRNARVKFIVGEGITDFIEDAVFKGKITRGEAMEVYFKFGHAFGMEDLLPRPYPKDKLTKGETEYLKAQIKARIKNQTIANVEPLPVKKRIIGKK
jgi:hypothetical protein